MALLIYSEKWDELYVMESELRHNSQSHNTFKGDSCCQADKNKCDAKSNVASALGLEACQCREIGLEWL